MEVRGSRDSASDSGAVTRMAQSIEQLRQGMVRIQTDLFPLAIQTTQMLESEAVGASAEAIALHQKQKPLTLAMLGKYARLLDPEQSTIDTEVAEFASWEDRYGYLCSGMRIRESNTHHGVVRSVKPGEWIAEGTFKEGFYNGLVRVVYKDKIIVGLFYEGKQLARVEFDAELLEIEREDPNELLTELSV